MRGKKLAIWTGTLAVVVVIIIIANVLGNREASDKARAFFPEFKEENCSAFMIADKSDTVMIKRKGDIWVVAAEAPGKQMNISASPLGDKAESGEESTEQKQTQKTAQKREPAKEYPADSASVQAVMEKLAAMKRDDLISQNPEKQSLFEVDSAKGIYVEVWDRQGESLGAFRIGKSGPDWSSHYVRKVGSDNVYSVRGSIRYSFFADDERWRDKTVVKFDRTAAERIALVKKGGMQIVLEKEADTTGAAKWVIAVPEQHKAKTDEVNNLLNALSNYKATGWEESPEVTDSSAGFTNPELKATVTLRGGAEKVLLVGKKADEGEKWWVTSSDRRDAIMLVGNHSVEKLDKSLEELKAPAEVKAEEEE